MALTKEQQDERFRTLYGMDVETTEREVQCCTDSIHPNFLPDHIAAAMSILSDAQHLMGEGNVEARQRINFAKKLMMNCKLSQLRTANHQHRQSGA